MPNANVLRVADFIGTLGVCAHIDDTGSSYSRSDVAGQLAFLGISNVRVEAPSNNLAAYTALGQAGIRFDVICSSTDLSRQMGWIDSIAPYVASVEGPNEVNTSPVGYAGLTGAAAADAFQQDLFGAVKADPKLAGVSVLPFSLSVGGSLDGFGDVSAYADEGNFHGYASDGVPPYYMLGYARTSVTTTPGKPAVMTETGYYTLANGSSGVNQDVQAKWLVDTLLQNAADGVAGTFLYQLEDSYSDPRSDPENHYGLFTVGGQAKLAATAIHNLTTLLADGGSGAASFTPGQRGFGVSGLSPDYGFQQLFAKSDGRLDLALWSEPDFFDAKTGIEATVAPSTVTVALGGRYDVDVFDPIRGTAAIAHYTGVSSVQVLLGTDALIVEARPDAASAVACFCRGTLILTVEGEVAVETLRPGDLVVTAGGAAKPVRWIGQRRYPARTVAAHAHLRPVLIRAGTLGTGLPRRDLRVSQAHAMALDGVLVPAANLVDGIGIVLDRSGGELGYFHVELDEHDIIFAEGAPTETFLDDNSRGMFSNAAEAASSPMPPGTAKRFCVPRVEDGFQMEAIRLRLPKLSAAARSPIPN